MTSGVPAKCLVRGSINIDEFLTVHHIVESGETINSAGYTRRPGGKGANQAVSVAKAGGKVSFAGVIGKDGLFLRDTLGGFGVDTEYLLEDDELPTGRAIIQVSTTTKDNAIVLVSGANFPSRYPLPSLSRFTHLLLQNEVPLPHTIEAFRSCKKDGLDVVTMFNPSPMPTEDEIENEIPWDCVDWLIVNKGEALSLLRILGVSVPEGDGGTGEVLKGFGGMREKRGGPRRGIVITLGEKGVQASVRIDGREWREFGEPAGKVLGGVKDTTGAGDCFTGYLAAQLMNVPADRLPRSEEIERVLKVSSQASAMCVEEEGTLESVPMLEEVRKRLGE